jgi:hypothetical protein
MVPPTMLSAEPPAEEKTMSKRVMVGVDVRPLGLGLNVILLFVIKELLLLTVYGTVLRFNELSE